MPFVLGGVVLVLLAVLSLSASEGEEGRRRAQHTLLGAALIGVAVFSLARAGLPGLALGVVLLFTAWKRLAGGMRSSQAPRPEPERPEESSTQMSRAEAYQVLGVSEGATRDEILSEYRRLMKKVHPDQGGNTYLAARLNEARAVLLD